MLWSVDCAIYGRDQKVVTTTPVNFTCPPGYVAQYDPVANLNKCVPYAGEVNQFLPQRQIPTGYYRPPTTVAPTTPQIAVRSYYRPPTTVMGVSESDNQPDLPSAQQRPVRWLGAPPTTCLEKPGFKECYGSQISQAIALCEGYPAEVRGECTLYYNDLLAYQNCRQLCPEMGAPVPPANFPATPPPPSNARVPSTPPSSSYESTTSGGGGVLIAAAAAIIAVVIIANIAT